MMSDKNTITDEQRTELENDRYSNVAVIIPCYNEEVTISKVVADFKRELPGASIYVYDNNSSDRTSDFAIEAGAIVKAEQRQGKGNVVRQMIRDIDADYYVMVDGDDTYPAEAARELLQPLFDDKADMVVGDRLSNGTYASENDRAFHGFGNDLVRFLIKIIYGFEFSDVMTGYRAFNRVFAKTMPVISDGFQIETELSIHAVDKRWRIVEIPIEYRDRPEGSESKLSTVSDGMKVIMTIMSLFKDYRPLMLFGLLSIILCVIGVIIGIPVILDYTADGFVSKIPSAILTVCLIGIGIGSLFCGLILDTVVKRSRKDYELNVIQAYDNARNRKKYIQ